MTSCSTLIEIVFIVYSYSKLFVETRRFNLPHRHLAPPSGVISFEFREYLWHKSPWAIMRRGLRDPVFCHFDTIPACDRHTDGQTHTDTRRQHVLR